MTQLLEQALAEVARLPEDEQDAVAALVLAEVDAERRWTAAFRASPDQLAALAHEAIGDDRRGRTQTLEL